MSDKEGQVASNSKKKGRPSLELTPQLKEIVPEIINRYREEVKPRGEVSINGIVRFCEELYLNNEIDIQLKEHFWKNSHGRGFINRVNEVIYSIHSEKSNSKKLVIDTHDVIEKFFEGNNQSKKKLLLSLKRNEDNLLGYIKENERLNKKMDELESNYQKIKEENTNQKNRLQFLQELYFSWMDASASNDNFLINAITTGKTRTYIVDEFFEKGFDNLEEGFQDFEKFYREQRKYQLKESNYKERNIIDDINF